MLIGTAQFSGQPGHLRVQVSGPLQILQLDSDGVRKADFEVQLNGLRTIDAVSQALSQSLLGVSTRLGVA